jgi:hypothetical protein
MYFAISIQVKNHPIKEQPRDSPSTMILSKPPTIEVCCLLVIELMVFPCIFSTECNSSSFFCFHLFVFIHRQISREQLLSSASLRRRRSSGSFQTQNAIGGQRSGQEGRSRVSMCHCWALRLSMVL